MAAILDYLHTCFSLQALAHGVSAGLVERGFAELQFRKFKHILPADGSLPTGLHDMIALLGQAIGRSQSLAADTPGPVEMNVDAGNDHPSVAQMGPTESPIAGPSRGRLISPVAPDSDEEDNEHLADARDVGPLVGLNVQRRNVTGSDSDTEDSDSEDSDSEDSDSDQSD